SECSAIYFSRFGKNKLLYILTVVTVCGKRRSLAKTIVEDSRAGTNNCLWRMRAVGGTRRPGDGKPRRKIKFAAGVVLYFIAKAEAESEIRLVAPIVLHVRFNIKLAH